MKFTKVALIAAVALLSETQAIRLKDDQVDMPTLAQAVVDGQVDEATVTEGIKNGSIDKMQFATALAEIQAKTQAGQEAAAADDTAAVQTDAEAEATE